MAKIKEVLQKDPTSEVNILFWAACALAFFGFLRCGEFTGTIPVGIRPKHSPVNDIAIDSADSPSLIQVSIKQSKTDPFRKGVQLFLAKTGKNICPITAIMPYLALRVHIKMLGRWKSNAYQLYVRTPREKLALLSKQLVSNL